MKQQSFKNHSQYVPGFHLLLYGLLLAGLVGSIVNISNSEGENLYSASLICLLFVCAILISWYARTFALKAQDRAIRAEEHFRYYLLSGKPADRRLTIRQLIALRFADDDEVLDLANRAASESLQPKEIKRLIKTWRGDHHRV